MTNREMDLTIQDLQIIQDVLYKYNDDIKKDFDTKYLHEDFNYSHLTAKLFILINKIDRELTNGNTDTGIPITIQYAKTHNCTITLKEINPFI